MLKGISNAFSTPSLAFYRVSGAPSAATYSAFRKSSIFYLFNIKDQHLQTKNKKSLIGASCVEKSFGEHMSTEKNAGTLKGTSSRWRKLQERKTVLISQFWSH